MTDKALYQCPTCGKLELGPPNRKRLTGCGCQEQFTAMAQVWPESDMLALCEAIVSVNDRMWVDENILVHDCPAGDLLLIDLKKVVAKANAVIAKAKGA